MKAAAWRNTLYFRLLGNPDGVFYVVLGRKRLQFYAEKEVDVCAGEGAIVSGSPLALVKRLADTKIEREVAYDVVFQAYICASSETIDGCTGVGVEYIVLVAIDTVCPITCVEELEAESHCERMGRQGGATDSRRVGDVLIDGEAIGEGLIGC